MLKAIQTAAILTGMIFASSINISPDVDITEPIAIEAEVETETEPEVMADVEVKPVNLSTKVGFAEVIENVDISKLEPEPVVEEVTRREVTDEEYKLLLRVCMSECGSARWGNEPMEAKIAVVETILNRVDMGYGTITEVIMAPNQYSTADNGEPDWSCEEAVEAALTGNMYPDNMLYYRTDYYHDFGIPYKQIGSHYFSCK